MKLEGLDSEDETARLVEWFRSLGPCVAVSGKKSVWIAESAEHPSFFHIQQTVGAELHFTKRPMKLSALRFLVRHRTGLDIDELVFTPCEGLLLDPLTGRILGDSATSGFVYFLQSAAGGPIKIGFAMDVDRRVRDLQTAHPITLKVLAVIPGTRSIERWLHGTLSKQCVRGEWFEDCYEVQAVIREVIARAAGGPHSVLRPSVERDELG